MDVHGFEMIRKFTWFLHNGYVCTNSQAKTLEYMHRMLIPCDVPGLSVDHVNCIKTDNRRENLRLATQSQQNANRGARSDKSAPSQALLDAGIEFLPKGVRWDRSAGRYTCFDHALSAAGAYNGTRSSSNSELAKFKDCVSLLSSLLRGDPAFSEAASFQGARVRMVAEYNAIVACAHAFDPDFPDGPYYDAATYTDELSYAEWILERLAHVPVVSGAPNYAYHEIECGGAMVARVKNGTVTLYDACFKEALENVNWDVSGKGPVVALPSTSIGGPTSKQDLALYIWTRLKGMAPLRDGESLIPVNYQRFDVRLDNLMLVDCPGTSFRPPKNLTPPDGVDVGMRFLPKGVSLSGQRVLINQAAGLRPTEFEGVDEKGTMKLSFCRKTDTDISDTVARAVAIIRKSGAGRDFDASNAKYQRLLGEFVDTSLKLQTLK